MKQSRTMSMVEAAANVVVGYVLAIATRAGKCGPRMSPGKGRGGGPRPDSSEGEAA